MSYVNRKVILALVGGLAATVLVLLSLSVSNTQAVTSTINSAAGSDFSTLREREPSVQASCPLTASLVETSTVPCLQTSNTLTGLISCTLPYMPCRACEDHRNGFTVPTAMTRTQWITVVGQMMEGRCDDIDLSEYEWGRDFTVTTFTNTQNSSPYCVFMETTYGVYTYTENTTIVTITRVTHGWGTFIYNPNYLRDLNISAPHPRFDKCTSAEAIGIFEKTQSRTFLMAGAHRYANNTEYDCPLGYKYKSSDAAHYITHTFQATIEALKEYYDSQNSEFYHLQFHGKGTDTCTDTDVYMTHGVSTAPKTGDKIVDLKSNLLSHNPSWTVTVPGDDPYCKLHGNHNVQGRLLNGVPPDQICVTPTTTGYSGHFIHIEQRRSLEQSCFVYRNPDNWINAINDTWPLMYYLPIILKNY